MNDFQARRFVQNMIGAMFNTVSAKKIAIFGFAFKANTGDTRESPACAVCHQLLEERAELSIYDPKALANAKIDLADAQGKINYCTSPYEAAKGAHAIAIMTEWNESKELDYQRIFDNMEKPAFIFDGRNIVDHQYLYELGFNVYPIGKKSLVHV